jgi:hypothetical protein
MENKLKIVLLAAIALGIWVQVFQNVNQNSVTRNVSVVNDVNVKDITPKPPVSDEPIDINIAAINGKENVFLDDMGHKPNGRFGGGRFGSSEYFYLPVHVNN